MFSKRKNLRRRCTTRLKKLFLFSVALLALTARLATSSDLDPCEHWADLNQNQCKQCALGYVLALLSDHRVLCAKTHGDKCTIDSFYSARENNPVEDPDTLELYTVKVAPGDTKICYSCTSLNSDNGSQFTDCKRCGDSIDESESIGTANALTRSVGCAVCQDGFKPRIEAHPVFPEFLLKRKCVQEDQAAEQKGQLCGWNQVLTYDSNFNEESLNHDGSLVCSECSDVIPGCSWCTSSKTCLLCEPGAFAVSDLTSYGNSLACFHDFCGFKKGISQPDNTCKDCSIEFCNECAFDSGDETCLRCDPAFNLSPDTKSCTVRQDSAVIDLFVVAFNGHLMDDKSYPTLDSQKSTSTTFGETIAEPYAFIQQALNQISTAKELDQFESVDVTVYLGKGTHFFFACTQGLSADVSSITGVTDFCSEIDSLKQAYAKTDNVKLTLKPLDCSLQTAAVQADLPAFEQNCVDPDAQPPQTPIVVVNSAFVNFNVTNEAVFEDIIFEANDNLAFYTEAPNKGKPVEEFPLQFCEQTFGEKKSHHDYYVSRKAAVQFGFDCLRPSDLDPQAHLNYPSTQKRCSEGLSNSAKPACSGEPYSKDFYSEYSGYFAKRRRVLFNLYAFDDFHTAERKTPSLTLRRCRFSHFMSGQHEALIQVETNNLYPVHFDKENSDGKGYMKHLGADNGAKILIEGSQFEFSRFCKGLIVYREGVDYHGMSSGVFSYQKEARGDFVDWECKQCQIVLKDSEFKHLNHATELRTLRPLLDYSHEVRNSTKLDSSGLAAGAVTAPIFQNFASVLNLQDFRGRVEVTECKFSQNMINIPDIIEPVTNQDDNSSLEIEHENINFYLNQITNQYELAVCEEGQERNQDVFLLGQGIKPYLDESIGLSSLFNKFERHSGAIYISRPTKPLIFVGNTFTENIGLFGGAITINSPNFQALVQDNDDDEEKDVLAENLPYLVFHENDFTRNMAYMSGNAVFIEGTKPYDQKLRACLTGLHATQNTFRDNFGFKISDGGAVSLSCSEVTDTNELNFSRSSSVPASLKEEDSLSESTIIAITDPSKVFTPHKRTSYLYANDFVNNHAGRKGAAVYIKGVSDVLIESSNFFKNRAVDVLQEKRFVPAYSKYFLGVNPLQVSTFRSFSLLVEAEQVELCGQTEIDYLARCADSKTLIPQSVLQGTLYYEGGQTMHCDTSVCRDETLIVKDSNFEGNEINYNYQWDQDDCQGEKQKFQSSAVFIKDARKAVFSLCSFKKHQKSSALEDYLLQNLPGFHLQFPKNYFSSSHASLIRVEQSDEIGLDLPFNVTFTQNTFEDNLGFQLLGFGPSSYYRGSLVHVNSQDSVVNNHFVFKLNKIYTCKVIGPETSLVYIKDARYVQIFGNHPRYNGHVSTEQFYAPIFAFTPNQSVMQLADQVAIFYAQDYGVFFLDTIVEVQVEGNSFEWCGAIWGAGFFNLNSAYRGWDNSYKYMIAMNGGAVMRSVGVDIRQAINKETTLATLGVAYDFQGGAEYEDQVSMYFMKNIIATNCAGPEAGFMRLTRSGGIQCNKCEFKFRQGYDKQQAMYTFRDGPERSRSVLDESYAASQLNYSFNEIAPVAIFHSQYEGSALNFTIGDESFQASPKTKPDYLWFKHCQFQSLHGGLSGVFYVENSNLYFSNVDGALTRRLSESNQGGRRELAPSIFITSNNVALVGAGFVQATSNSKVIFKGQNLQQNKGVQGGVISLRESSLIMEHTVVDGSSSSSHGGFLAAVNSHFHIQKSVIKNSSGIDGCVVYSSGEHMGVDQQSLIAFTNIKENDCKQSLFQLVNSNIKVDKTRFADNSREGGSSGITAVSSKLELTRLEVLNTDQVPKKKNIVPDVGFLTLLEGTEASIQLSRLQMTFGAIAGAIYSRGPNKVTISATDFESCVTAKLTGALLDIEGAETLEILGSNFFRNEGAPVLRVLRSDVQLIQSKFRQTSESNFIIAIDTKLHIHKGTFFQGGNTDLLGGAVFWEGKELSVIDSTFQENFAASGGALYVTGIGSSTSIDVKKNKFLSNAAQQGGALAIRTVQQMNVLQNTFKFNKAEPIIPQTVTSVSLPSRKAQGGAIYHLCLEAFKQDCAVQLLGNIFQNNIAKDGGGATIWLNKPFIDHVDPESADTIFEEEADADEKMPIQPEESSSDDQDEKIPETDEKEFSFIDDNIQGDDINQEEDESPSGDSYDNQYMDNSSGNGEASFAKLLVFNAVSNNDPQEPDDQARKDALQYDSFRVVSGTPLSFTITITDLDGETVTDPSSIQTAEINVEWLEGDKTADLTGNRVFAVDGVLDFTGFTIVTEPGTTLKVKLTVNLDSEVDSSSYFAQNQVIDVNVRPCLDGEMYTEAKTCVVCPVGTYLMNAVSKVTFCNQCESNGLCFGENKIAPKEAFWSPSPRTVKFLACINPDACLKGDPEHLTGRCADKYEGPLCSNCSKGYYLTGAGHVCEECPQTDLMARFIALALFVCFLFGVGTVVVTLANSLIEIRPMNFIPAAIKLLATHLQLVFVFARIQMRSSPSQWLTQSLIFLQTPLVDEYRKITKCWLQDEDDDDSSWVNGEKLAWMLMPIGVFFMAVIITTGILYLLKRLSSWPFKLYQLASATFFLVHVEVAFQILTTFDCVDFLGERVLADNLDQKCFSQSDSRDGDHLKFILSLCIPFGVLWVLIAPTAMLIYTRTQKDQIQSLAKSNQKISNLASQDQIALQRTQFRFGFNLNGLRKETYLWDSVTIARNFGFVALYVTLHATGCQQVSIMLGLICYLVPFLVLQVSVKPFQLKWLNYLEAMSLATILLYLLNELQEASREYNSSPKWGESLALSIFFVAVPTLAFLFFALRFLREQILSLAFHQSHRLFKVLSCGSKRAGELYAHNKIVDLQKQQTTGVSENISVSNLSEVADPKSVRLNFKKLEASKKKSLSGKIIHQGGGGAKKRSRTAYKSGKKSFNNAVELIIKSESKRSRVDGSYSIGGGAQSSVSDIVTPRKLETQGRLDTQVRLDTHLDANDTQQLVHFPTENVPQELWALEQREKEVLKSGLHAKGKQKKRLLINEDDSDQQEKIDFQGLDRDLEGEKQDSSPLRDRIGRARTALDERDVSTYSENISKSITIADDPKPSIQSTNLVGGQIYKRTQIQSSQLSARRQRMPIIDNVTNSVVLNTAGTPTVGNGMAQFEHQKNTALQNLNQRSVTELLTPEKRSTEGEGENVQQTVQEVQSTIENVTPAKNFDGIHQLLSGVNSVTSLQSSRQNQSLADAFQPKFTQSRNFGDSVLKQNLLIRRQQSLDQQSELLGISLERLKGEEELRGKENEPFDNGQLKKAAVKASPFGTGNIFCSDDDIEEPSSDDSVKINARFKASSTFKTIKETEEDGNVSGTNSAFNSVIIRKPEEKYLKSEKKL